MGLGAGVGAVQLQMSAASLSGPPLGGVEQRLPDPLRAVLRADRQVLDPAARSEANRVQIEVGGAEAEQLAALLSDQNGGGRVLDRARDRGPGPIRIPTRWHRPGWRKEPLV